MTPARAEALHGLVEQDRGEGPLLYAQYDNDFMVKGMPVIGGVALSALDEDAQVELPRHFPFCSDECAMEGDGSVIPP